MVQSGRRVAGEMIQATVPNVKDDHDFLNLWPERVARSPCLQECH